MQFHHAGAIPLSSAMSGRPPRSFGGPARIGTGLARVLPRLAQAFLVRGRERARWLLVPVSLAVGALGSGCATLFDFSVPRGQDFDIAAARQIQDETTSKADVERMFGPPGNVTTTGDSETWTYGYQRAVPGREKTWGAGTMNAYRTRTETTVTYQKVLSVTFDRRGVVTFHQVTESGRRPTQPGEDHTENTTG